MRARIVDKEDEYVLNHCTKYLARDNSDARHSLLGVYDGQPRAAISECWRFPVIDSHDGREADAYDWNDVTFVHFDRSGRQPPVALLTTCHALYEPLPLRAIGDSGYACVTLRVPKAQRHRYVFIVDGERRLDEVNPQTETLANGAVWSSFYTWAYNQPINFERWEFVILERLTRHVLPFKTAEATNFLKRGASEGTVAHLYRLYESVGVANYIDNIVCREERHRLVDYKICLQMIAAVLRKRHPGKDPGFVDTSGYAQLYDDMINRRPSLFADGWDSWRYGDPWYFVYLLRRHAITGAFSHPKYGGNAGAMAWAYLSERYTADGGGTAFDWRRVIEPPLGTSTEYRG